MADLNNISVIYYHSVGPVKRNWKKRFLTLVPDIFEKHLEWLNRKFTTISFREYWLIRQGLLSPVKNPLVITFDDGYLDNWIWAFPLLKKRGLKATIFVSPEFVDEHAGCRPNSEDYEKGRAGLDEITRWGFLSWDEMRVMESSGLIDIQSHSLTHTKYFVSDKLTGFHHPGGDILYPVVNIFPERKPFYIESPDFESLLPYGFPLFEEKPALVARRAEINQDFVNECVDLFKTYDFTGYDLAGALKLAGPLYTSYRKENKLIARRESEAEYRTRVKDEIYLSKRIIEEKLNKKVEVLCWPHGSNDEFLHRMAMEAGYLMTTTGKATGINKTDITRIPDRAVADMSSMTRKIRSLFKMKAFSGERPYADILKAYRWFKNGL